MAMRKLRDVRQDVLVDIVDDGEHIREGYGAQTGDWVLVRPDGYVGAIVAADRVAALESYLGDVGMVAG